MEVIKPLQSPSRFGSTFCSEGLGVVGKGGTRRNARSTQQHPRNRSTRHPAAGLAESAYPFVFFLLSSGLLSSSSVPGRDSSFLLSRAGTLLSSVPGRDSSSSSSGSYPHGLVIKYPPGHSTFLSVRIVWETNTRSCPVCFANMIVPLFGVVFEGVLPSL